LGDVAAKVNMSESAFSHFFQKVAFRSFTQFLLDVRIGHACRLLLNTDETVSQICFKSGFNNLANFNRLFKKYRLCTPVEYRKRYFEKDQFDWTKQVTPWQFLPGQAQEHIKPANYATRLVHL
jgi:AraC-like DNA-binding protein